MATSVPHSASRAGSIPGLTPLPAVQRPWLSVVICTLNEHEAIGRVLVELAQSLAGIRHEIIVVDDSPDERTAEAVQRYQDTLPVRLLRRPGARGLSSAAIAGWDAARGEVLAIMDGDGQHDPQLLCRLLDQMDRDGTDVAVASRYLENRRSGLNPIRHAISRSGTRLSAALLGIPLADPLSGCFMMRRDWYARVRPKLSGLGFKILVDVVASIPERPTVSQSPTELRQRLGGESKLSLRVALELLVLLVEKRTQGRWTATRQAMALRCMIAWMIQIAGSIVFMKLGVRMPWALVLAILLSAPLAWLGKPAGGSRTPLRAWFRPLPWVALVTGLAVTTQYLGLPWVVALTAGMLLGGGLAMKWGLA